MRYSVALRGGDEVGDKAPPGLGLEESVNQATTHPEYVWWNGERRPWDECTIHVTELGWSTVGRCSREFARTPATMTSSTSFVCASIWSG